MDAVSLTVYGAEEIFALVSLAAHHTFLDIGSGICLVAIQAAAT